MLLLRDSLASEYLTAYWLGRNVSYWVKFDNRYSYSKWIVLNFLWTVLAKDLKKIAVREAFRKASERPSKFAAKLQPLDNMVKLALRMSLTFYSKNKRIDGKMQEPIDFFKHVKYHIRFRDFINKNEKKKLMKLEKLKDKFIIGIGGSDH